MRIAIRNTTIVTADAARTVRHDATLVVDGDRIAAIDPTNRVGAEPGTEVIDGRGKAVFPGLSNCHTHFHLTHSRGIQEDFGFPSTLRFPATVASLMSKEELSVFAALGAVEAIRCGTTAPMEIGFDVPDYAAAIVPSGLRLVLAQSASDVVADAVTTSRMFSPATRRRVAPACVRPDRALARRREWTHHLLRGCARARGVLARAAPGQPRARGVEAHALHDPPEPEPLGGGGGPAPARRAPDRVPVPERLPRPRPDRGALPVHGAVRGGAARAEPRVRVAQRRHGRPAGAAPPIQALAAAGCTIAMGSDNMAEDMVEVMRTGLFMERVIRQDAQSPQPEDVLEWAARNGARALGLGEIAGSLEVGKKADLFVVDARKPNLVPAVRIVSAFVHNGQGADVESVMVDGRWIMRDRKILTLDEEDIVARAEAIGQRTWRQLVEKYPDVPFPIRLPRGGGA